MRDEQLRRGDGDGGHREVEHDEEGDHQYVFQAFGFEDVDVVQVFVVKGKQVPSGTMMLARNPITIISATKSK